MKNNLLQLTPALFPIVCPLLLCAVACFAQPGAPTDADSARRVLAKSSRFAIGLLGEGGDIGGDQRALNVILAAPNPESHLNSLLKESSAIAKLYGLCGLKALDSEHYQSRLASFKTSAAARKNISTQSGCEMWTELAEETLKRLELDCSPKHYSR